MGTIIRRHVERVERLVEELAVHDTTGQRSTAHADHSRPLWADLLVSLDRLTSLISDVRSCAALVQQYSHSRQHLQQMIQLLVHAATLEDTILRSPAIHAALLAVTPTPNPRLSPSLPSDGDPNPVSDPDSACGHPVPELMLAGRRLAALGPRFVREGYHPADPNAYSVVMRRGDKEAMLDDVRREQRRVLAALKHLLGFTGEQSDGSAGASGSGRRTEQGSGEGLREMNNEFGNVQERGTGFDDPYLRALDSKNPGRGVEAESRDAVPWPPPFPPAGWSPAAAASPGEAFPYDWPEVGLTVEELTADPVLAEVAALQWGLPSLPWAGGRQEVSMGGRTAPVEGAGEDDWAAGGNSDTFAGSLLLTLDASAALLQKHPDPLLRDQVYEQGLLPLSAAALRLMQELRDLRAKEAALYGLYDVSGSSQLPAYGTLPAAPQAGSGAVGAGGTGDRGDGGGGFAALAHMDTLARDGRAVAAFLTSLAEALKPLVSEQVERLRHFYYPDCGNIPPASFEHLLRRAAWEPPSRATSAADADATATAPCNSVAIAAGAANEDLAGDHHDCTEGPLPDQLGDANTGDRNNDSGTGSGEHSCGESRRSVAALSSDPAEGYLRNLGAVMQGVSSWLQAFMDVRLVRPGGDSAPEPAPLVESTGPDGDGQHRDNEAPTRVGRVRELPAEDMEVETYGNGSMPGLKAEAADAVPYDVGVMLDELADLYGLGGSGGSTALPAAAAAGGACRDVSSMQAMEHRGLALAAVREAAGREPGRFLAYQVRVEGEERAARSREADGSLAAGHDPAATDGGGRCHAPVRWLLVDTRGGSGTRYLLPALVAAPAPEVGSPGQSGVAAPAVAAVVVGLQSDWRAGGDAACLFLTRGSDFRLWELMHELGHALHFLLAASPPQPSAAAPPGAGGRGSRDDPWDGSRGFSLLPFSLPLELVELPSSFLERAAGEADVVRVLLSHCRHEVTGQPPPVDVAARLAAAVRRAQYSPIGVQVQVLSSLLDQLLLLAPRKAPGLARRLWPQLLGSFAPSLPVECSIQQLHSLSRIADTGGQGYAYVVAAYLADELWAACYPGGGTQQPPGRGLCIADPADPADAASADDPAPDSPQDGQDARAQAAQGVLINSNSTGNVAMPLSPSWGGSSAVLYRSAQCGRLVRQLLFQKDATEEPPSLLLRLLTELYAFTKQASVQINAGLSADGVGRHSTAQGQGDGESPRSATVVGGLSASLGDDRLLDVHGKHMDSSLSLIRLAGGGCVPKVCARRVRRWVGEVGWL